MKRPHRIPIEKRERFALRFYEPGRFLCFPLFEYRHDRSPDPHLRLVDRKDMADRRGAVEHHDAFRDFVPLFDPLAANDERGFISFIEMPPCPLPVPP